MNGPSLPPQLLKQKATNRAIGRIVHEGRMFKSPGQ